MSLNQQLRKTHPMVLVAAVALTIFSLLGSAAITGLLPTAHSDNAAPTESIGQADAAESGHATGVDQFYSKARPANGNAQPSVAMNAPPAAVCADCGRIVSIRAIEQEGEASGLGAVAGGVAGGVIGNQIGKGRGNTLMTVLGVGGGAYAGHEIEKNMKAKTAYVIRIEMQDGSIRKVTQYNEPQFAVGDRVRLNRGQLVNA